MLLLQSARKPPRSQGRIGLAIAGGGPIGGMYELGALRALDEAIEGLDMTKLDVYVGVSSGAFLAAGLANRLSTAEMHRIFITGDSHEAKFSPQIFLHPAFLEYIRRGANLPSLAYEWWRELLLDPTGSHLSNVVSRLGGLIPTGIFNNVEIENFLRKVFTSRGRSNDFRELDRRLYVVAVDLDNGQAVRFGGPEWDDVPTSVITSHITASMLQEARAVPATAGLTSDWPVAWATDTIQAGKPAFQNVTFSPVDGQHRWHVVLGSGYNQSRMDLQQGQVIKAGARLAQILEELFP